MNAEQLAAVIDQVYAGLHLPAKNSASNELLFQAISRTTMLSSLASSIVGLRLSPREVTLASRSMARGIIIGIQVGKAVREVEELEGLGR